MEGFFKLASVHMYMYNTEMLEGAWLTKEIGSLLCMCQLKRNILECKWVPVLCRSPSYMYHQCMHMKEGLTSNFLPLKWQRWVTVDSIQVEINLLWIRIRLQVMNVKIHVHQHYGWPWLRWSLTLIRVTPTITPCGSFIKISKDTTSASTANNITHQEWSIQANRDRSATLFLTRYICEVDWSEDRRALRWRVVEFETGYLSSYGGHHQFISSFQMQRGQAIRVTLCTQRDKMSLVQAQMQWITLLHTYFLSWCASIRIIYNAMLKSLSDLYQMHYCYLRLQWRSNQLTRSRSVKNVQWRAARWALLRVSCQILEIDQLIQHCRRSQSPWQSPRAVRRTRSPLHVSP